MSDKLEVIETEHGTLLRSPSGEMPNVVVPDGMQAQYISLSTTRLPHLSADQVLTMQYDGTDAGADRLIVEAAGIVARALDDQPIHVEARWLPCSCPRLGCRNALVLLEVGLEGAPAEGFGLVHAVRVTPPAAETSTAH